MRYQLLFEYILPYTPTSQDLIENLIDRYQDWVYSNLGYNIDIIKSYDTKKGKLNLLFIFKTIEDVMAFKLRWL